MYQKLLIQESKCTSALVDNKLSIHWKVKVNTFTQRAPYIKKKSLLKSFDTSVTKLDLFPFGKSFATTSLILFHYT